ncbi:hypothetical protein GCK72_004615 [Caenorhabditis remanei]|uniref:MADF domain-containing protein n=1 Tax=Caenorhabditis remanei TaxID=31234 RepID=A0A6A5HCW1_CAERE|nr:hypothetical protein GCK72_004615 [Caenorhabditis remanei]KAF1764666.1 hypothetical protein GCK72_004615 [Caenorhabditis remanei]
MVSSSSPDYQYFGVEEVQAEERPEAAYDMNYQSTRFNEEMIEPTFNLRLIEAVRHSRCLFDNTDRQYRNTEYKNRVWQRLVSILNFDGDPRMLSARWKQLRDKYGKEKRKQKYGQDKSSWQYFKHLHFLDPHMTDRADVSPSRKEPNGVQERVNDPHFAKSLIQEVQRHPCLYDVRDPKYRHGDCRTQAWGMIIEKLQYPGTVPSIYKQWKKHRDRYVREKRRLRNMMVRVDYDGDANLSDLSTWDMFEEMQWIDQHLDEHFPEAGGVLCLENDLKTLKNTPDSYFATEQISRCARSLKRGPSDVNNPDDGISEYEADFEAEEELNYLPMSEKRGGGAQPGYFQPNNPDVLLDGDSAFSASIVSDLRTLNDEARIVAKQQIMLLLDTAPPPISTTPAPNYM